MPFGGLLTVGIIGAAGSLGSAAIGAHGASTAGKALDKRAIEVGQSIDKATGGAIDAGYQGIAQANTALSGSLADANAAIASNAAAANAALAGGYQTAQGYIAPYQQAGQQGLGQLAAFAAGPGSQAFQWDPANDPGYQFRLNQGAKALANQASTRGGLQGGGYAKALSRYSQDYASSEYQKAFERDLEQKKFQSGLYSNLAGFGERANTQGIQAGEFYTGNQAANNMALGQTLSNNFGNYGRSAANVALQGNQYIGNVGLQGAEAAGNAYLGGALGRASGQVAAANAWAHGVGDAAGQIAAVFKPQAGQVGGTLGEVPYGVDPTAGIDWSNLPGSVPIPAPVPPPVTPAMYWG